MKLKKLFKNKLAFTLVELIVVIAILAILASVATVSTIAILNNTRKTPVENAIDAVKNTIAIYIAGGGKLDWDGGLAAELDKIENCSVPNQKNVGESYVKAVTGDAVQIFCKSENNASVKLEIRNQYFKAEFTVKSDGTIENEDQIKIDKLS